MTRHWAPLDGPQRIMMRLRATRDGRARSAVDLELPLMALLAIIVGIGVVIWLNGQGTGGGEIRRVTARPQVANLREALAEGAARERAEARARARVRRSAPHGARSQARCRRGTGAALLQPRQTGFQSGSGYGSAGAGTRTCPRTRRPTRSRPSPSSRLEPAPPPKSRPKPSGGGGGGAASDDSG